MNIKVSIRFINVRFKRQLNHKLHIIYETGHRRIFLSKFLSTFFNLNSLPWNLSLTNTAEEIFLSNLA